MNPPTNPLTHSPTHRPYPGWRGQAGESRLRIPCLLVPVNARSTICAVFSRSLTYLPVAFSTRHAAISRLQAPNQSQKEATFHAEGYYCPQCSSKCVPPPSPVPPLTHTHWPPPLLVACAHLPDQVCYPFNSCLAACMQACTHVSMPAYMPACLSVYLA